MLTAEKKSIVHPIWVRTPLIKPITDSGYKLRQPLLEVDDVTKVIVKHILSGSSGQISIPNHIGTGALLRGFPNWAQEWIRNYVSLDLKKARDALTAKELAQAKALQQASSP